MSVDWILLHDSSEREQEAHWARRNCVKPGRTLPGGKWVESVRHASSSFARQVKVLSIGGMIGLSGRLDYKGRDLSLSLLPGLSLSGLSLTSLFRPQSDDDVKGGTIVIRLRRT